MQASEHIHSHVVHIDDFLTPRALELVRKFCLESTVWYEIKRVGYLGAYWAHGFVNPLLLQATPSCTPAAQRSANQLGRSA